MFTQKPGKHALSYADTERRLKRLMCDPRTDIALLQRELAYMEGRNEAVARKLARDLAKAIGDRKRKPARFAW